MSLFSLAGRRALVTGANTGIGRGISEALAAAGATVVLAGPFHREADRDYTDAVARAVDDFCALAVSPHAQEGLRAFLEKRTPEWPAG